MLPSQRLREGSDLAHGLGIAEDRVEFLLEFGHVSRPLPPKCLLLLLGHRLADVLYQPGPLAALHDLPHQAQQGAGVPLGGGGDSNPLSALSELDPQLLQAGLRLFSEYSATDDRKVALLNALKPFVKPERYAKVDKAVQIAKLARVIRVAFQLFQSRREEGKDDV